MGAELREEPIEMDWGSRASVVLSNDTLHQGER